MKQGGTALKKREGTNNKEEGFKKNQEGAIQREKPTRKKDYERELGKSEVEGIGLGGLEDGKRKRSDRSQKRSVYPMEKGSGCVK